MFNPFHLVGNVALRAVQQTGALFMFLVQTFAYILRLSIPIRLTLKQCELIGFNSLAIVILTAFFTGGVLALQSFYGIDNVVLANNQLGRLVSLSMLRELGPVLASLMIAGRVGAAMAAELGTMRVTEQIDALTTLSTSPMRYLVVPRMFASMLMLPFLVLIANVTGIFGGYIVAVKVLNMPGHLYLQSAFSGIGLEDITLGLVKAVVFGIIIALMGTYFGFNTKGGAAGVGKSTTTAVVYASVLILVADYFITALFTNTGGF